MREVARVDEKLNENEEVADSANEHDQNKLTETDENETNVDSQESETNEEKEQCEDDVGEERIKKLTAEIERLQAEVERLQEEKEKTYDKMLRIQAEYENYKKRSLREREAERKYKSQDLANELLPAIDNFERALQVEVTDETANFVEGMEMIYKQLIDALAAQGVEQMETVGQEFDPNLHHAVMQAEDEETESNIIVEELQKGYKLKDRVIRPAMVKVNK